MRFSSVTKRAKISVVGEKNGKNGKKKGEMATEIEREGLCRTLYIRYICTQVTQ